jgi:hypothetical protein
VGFLMAAANTEDSLRTPNPELRYDVFLERADKADRERFLGILATSIGGALVAGAVVRWVIVADAGPDRVGVAFLRSF